MELLTPGQGLILWQMLIVINIFLFAVSWIIILTTKVLDSRDRLSWLLATLLLPIVGPLLFLIKLKATKKAETKSN
jgi:hypothetical protein